MNYSGIFDAKFSEDGSGPHFNGRGHVESFSQHATHAPSDAIIVSDAHLLFHGDFKREGTDLILSEDGRELVLHDYFRGEKHVALASPDGAHLSGDIVDALTGHTQYAQAGGGGAAAVIGHVTKLTGNATAIRNGVAITLNVGDNVEKGDVVQSGPNSTLGLTFIDGTVFALSSNARMVLNDMVYDPNGSNNSSLLSLVAGTISFVAGETAKHGDMKVNTPVATMGIRGTAILVEIDFTVPGQGGAPPVKFQVLVEPDGHTGSYLLYSLTDPTVVIGQVNAAGVVTKVDGQGGVSTAPAPPLPPLVLQLLNDLHLGPPNNSNPRSTSPPGSTPANPPPQGKPGDTSPIKFDTLPTGTPTTIPVNLPSNPTDNSNPLANPVQVLVTITVLKAINVAPVVDTPSFNIGNQVTITDSSPSDTIVPYVPGTATILSVAGPAPVGTNLASLVSVDPQTGNVAYNPQSFAFLQPGQKVTVTVGFDSQAGTNTYPETLTLTIDNVIPTVKITTAAETSNQATQQISGTVAAGAAAIGDTVTLYDTVNGHKTELGTATVGSDGGWTATVTLSGNGTHSIVATDTDAAGYTGSSAPVLFTLNDSLVSFSSGTINTNGAYTPQVSHGGSALQLTDGNGNEAASWFANAVYSISGFTASFDYQATSEDPYPADGLAFILQNSTAGVHALGDGGGNLGYGGGTPISPSAAIEFNLFYYYGRGTAFETNGNTGAGAFFNQGGSPYQPTGNVAFWNGDAMHVVVSYNGVVLTETLTDLVNGATYSASYSVDLSSVLGGSTAYVGFSAGTGADVSTQTVSNFTYSNASMDVWTGTTGDWTDGTQWSLGAPPQSGSLVIIASGGHPQIVSGSVTLDGVVVQNSGEIDVGGGSTLTLHGTIINGGTIDDFSSPAGTIIAGDIDVTGSSTISGASLNKGGVTVESGATLTLDNDIVAATTFFDATGSIIRIDDGTSLTLSDVTINGGIINDGTAYGTAVGEGPPAVGNIDVTGSSTISGASLNNGEVTIESGVTLTLDDDTANGATFTDTASGATLSVDSGATLTLAGASVSGGTVSIRGQLASTGVNTLDGAAVAIAAGGAIKATAGTLTINSSSITSAGLLEASGGTLVINRPSAPAISFADQFVTDTALNSGWTTVSSNPASSVQLVPGAGLQITASPLNGGSDLYSYTNYDAPVVLRSIDPSLNWTIETELSFSPTDNYQGAGILLATQTTPFSSPSQYNRIAERAYYPDGAIGGNANIVEGAGGSESYTASSIYLEATKVGDLYTTSYSSDGIHWTVLGTETNTTAYDEIGLFTIRQPWDGAFQVSSVADFTFFDVSQPSTFTNTGTLRATASGTLVLNDEVVGNGSGTVQVDAGSTLDLNSSAIFGGTIADNGNIDIIASSAVDGANLSGGTVTVESGATLTLDNDTLTGTTFDNLCATGSILQVDYGTALTLDDVTINGGTVADGGIVQVDIGNTLTLDGVTINGGTLANRGSVIIGGPAGTTLDTANPMMNSGLLVVVAGRTLDVQSSEMHNTGSGPGNGVVIGNAAVLRVDSPGLKLTGGGDVVLQAGSDITENASNPYVVASGMVLALDNVDNTIAGSGEIGSGTVLYHGSPKGSLALTNEVDGTIEASGGTLIIDTGNVNGITNGGLLKVDTGSKLVIDDAVNGTGSEIIGDDGILEFNFSVASTQTITFTGAGELKLGDPANFHGQIKGLSGSDLLDLAGFVAATTRVTPSAYVNGLTTLTVTDASDSNTVNLTLVGDYSAGNFTLTSDGNRGSLLVLNPAAISASSSGQQIGISASADGSVTVNDVGNVSGTKYGIDAVETGATVANVDVNIAPNATINSTSSYGIRAVNSGAGSIYVRTSSGDLISSGSAGIDAVNQASAASAADDSMIVINAAGTIHSGSNTTNGTNHPPAGILAGYFGSGTTDPTSYIPGLYGNVIVNSSADITADAGDGIRAYNYGIGDVTVNDLAGCITALGGLSPPDGYGDGIAAYDYGSGNIDVFTAADTFIHSGSSGIHANNGATAGPSSSGILVVAYGTIMSGAIPTGSGNPAAGILAGYDGNNETAENDVHGNVTIDDYASITAPAGTDGIRGYNYGTGTVTVIAEAGAVIDAGRYGLAARGHDGGDVSITNYATVSATTAIDAFDTTGNVHIDNYGNITGDIIVGDPSSGDTAPFTGNATIHNDSGALWNLVGDSTFAGTSVLINDGTIDSNGTSMLTGLSGLTNHGLIDVQSGDLVIDTAMSGGGHVVLDGGSAEFGAASDAVVQFATDAVATLTIDNPSQFTGTVTSFAAGDAIDLAGIAPSAIRFTGDATALYLQYDSNPADHFSLGSGYTAANFSLAADGHGGTNVVFDQAPVIETDQFTVSPPNEDGATTISGLYVTDSDASDTFTLTATTADSGISSVTPSTDSGSLDQINNDLQTVTYNPGSSPPSTDMVTLTVADSLGATDTVHFVFNQSGSGPNIVLQGTSGDDVIFATGNSDVLTGGGGRDQFVFKPTGDESTVQHTITDFVAGVDKIDLRLFGAISPTETQQGSDTLVMLDSHDTLLLKNVTATSLHANDFILHAGA